MKRDMDLTREILIQIQDHKVERPGSWQVHIDGRDPAEVVEHVHMLVERGLVRGVPARSGGYTHYLDPNLTWEGHNFIVSARDDSTWARAKRTILERGGALVFEVLKQTLADLAKGQIPGH